MLVYKNERVYHCTVNVYGTSNWVRVTVRKKKRIKKKQMTYGNAIGAATGNASARRTRTAEYAVGLVEPPGTPAERNPVRVTVLRSTMKVAVSGVVTGVN